MLNQERVEEMIRLAIFDQKEGEACKPMIQYFRKDYIVKELLKSFVTGTLAFAIVIGLGIMCRAEELVNSLNTVDIKGILMEFGTAYLIFMAVYFIITYVIYYRRYSIGRQKVKKYYVHLKKVSRFYHQEDHS
ncbi:MAG: hypothetical protein NC307_06895 [Roseburia sp.]|nr:hypothetical protein [Roseburia sp.]